MSFSEITEANELEDLLNRSNEQPIIVFKHSTTCPISARAHREMEKVNGEVALVVVQHARVLSNEVAARTGIKHESPQVFVLRNGSPAWHASHYDITASDVEKAVSENG